MKSLITLALFLATMTCVHADGMDEVNEWRRRAGLRPFIEDPQMTEFAQMKARYRAERRLQNGHQGPQPPAGWHEGTGEATATWGWLTCEMESDYQYAGAGLCIGSDGQRYMVLVCRGGSGRALRSRQGAPVFNTSYLTPAPERVGQAVTTASATRTRCPDCGRYH